MSGDWFHQHFGVAKDGLRVLAWHGTEQSSGAQGGPPGRTDARLLGDRLSRAATRFRITWKIRRCARNMKKRWRATAWPRAWSRVFYEESGAAAADKIGGF